MPLGSIKADPLSFTVDLSNYRDIYTCNEINAHRPLGGIGAHRLETIRVKTEMGRERISREH